MQTTNKPELIEARDNDEQGFIKSMCGVNRNMSTTPKRFFTALSIMFLCLALTGCVEAVRVGVTDGISRGLNNSISDIVEGILADVLNTM